MFTVCTRQPYIVENFSTLEAALEAGFKIGLPFDVHLLPVGNVAWVWETRP